jgi:hypothetical protein
MRDQVIDTVGQIAPPLIPVLPTWMTSKQANGRVLGFTPAWVIAYLRPGQGDRVAYYIRTRYGEELNRIDFKADRYELDRSQTYLWNSATESWLSPLGLLPAATVFDGHRVRAFRNFVFTLQTSGQVSRDTTYVANGSTLAWGFQTQDSTAKLVVAVNGNVIPYWRAGLSGLCWQLQYTDGRPQYNITAWNSLTSYGTFATVVNNGSYYLSLRDVPSGIDISNAFYWQAIDPPNTVVIRNVASGGSNPAIFTGPAVSAGAAIAITEIYDIYTLDVNSPVTNSTVFDGGSTSFVSPADQYTGGDEFDRYLMFPKINIVDPTPTIPGPPPPPPSPVITWRNVRLDAVTWNNDSGNAVVWLNNAA